MKKLIAALTAACMILGLAACGSQTVSTADSTNAPESQTSTSASAETKEPEETYPLIAEQTDLNFIAAYSENFSFTKGEVAYFYAITFQNYYSYLTYLGVDPSVSLKEQAYSDEETWFDAFLHQSMRYVENYLLFSEAAHDRGITLDQDDLDYIASQKTQIEADAAEYGWDTDTYLEQLFGTNLNWEILEAALQKMLLGDKGYEAVTKELRSSITEEDILSKYQLGRLDYDLIDYVDINFLDGEGLTEEVKAELAKAFSEAKDTASFTNAVIRYVERAVDKEKIDDAGSAAQYADELIAANTRQMAQHGDGEMMDWAFSEDRTGDIFVDAEEHDGERHAYLLKAGPYRDEETYVDVRHILFKTETLGSAEAARAKAEEIYAKWQEGKKTEDSFADLAIEYSEDSGSASNGGLYEQVYRGEMVQSFEDWCFDPSRQPGDSGIVDTSYGSHIMYYVSSEIGWRISVLDDMMYELENDALEEIKNAHPITEVEEVLQAINW